MITDIDDIEKIFDEAESCESGVAMLTHEQVWRLILCDCELGGFTIEELLEHHRTGKRPKGKDNDYFSDASLLIEMFTNEMIDEFLK